MRPLLIIMMTKTLGNVLIFLLKGYETVSVSGSTEIDLYNAKFIKEKTYEE